MNVGFRAHLYEEVASLSARERDYDAATDALQKSIALRTTTPLQSGISGTLILLARVQILQNRLSEAGESSQRANLRLTFPDGRMLDRIVAAQTSGMLLNRRHDWEAARSILQSAVEMAKRSSSFSELYMAALQELITADTHLHLKKEEKGAKKELRAVEARLFSACANSTVDLADLKSSYAK